MVPKTKGHRKGPGVVDCVTKGHRKGHLVVECKSSLDIEVALVVPCRPAAGGVRVVAVSAAWPGSGWDFAGFRLGRGVSSGPRAWGVRLRAGVCRACVAAGSGFVVGPRASWTLVGDGGPLGSGGPAARPTGGLAWRRYGRLIGFSGVHGVAYRKMKFPSLELEPLGGI